MMPESTSEEDSALLNSQTVVVNDLPEKPDTAKPLAQHETPANTDQIVLDARREPVASIVVGKDDGEHPEALGYGQQEINERDDGSLEGEEGHSEEEDDEEEEEEDDDESAYEEYLEGLSDEVLHARTGKVTRYFLASNVHPLRDMSYSIAFC